jgi:hypothetical protein
MAVRLPDAMGKALTVDAWLKPGASRLRYMPAALRPAKGTNQFFNRYPVLKIHATTPIESARNPSVIAMLRPTLTSPVP